MKTARERAVEIAHKVLASNYTRAAFDVILADRSDGGDVARKVVETIERGIAEDRRVIASMGAPS